MLAAPFGGAYGQALTAGAIVEQLEPGDRYTFVAGIVEGLAYARFLEDGRSETPGMACIYRWFYETEATPTQIFQAFEAFPDHTPGAVVAAMAARGCD